MTKRSLTRAVSYMKLSFMKENSAGVPGKNRIATPAERESPTMGADGATYQVPAVDKAFDILELLGDASQGMSLTGISEALGRTKQELFRVLVSLQERGYLVRDDDQTYRLSTKLFEIGSKHASTQLLIAHAMPHMERLSRRLRQSCHLNIVVQNRMLVIARAEGDADVMLAVRIGATFELHRRTSGLVGLAFLPEHRRQDYWKQAAEAPRKVQAWESRLAEIRAQGFAHEESPIVVGVKDCAAAILGGGAGLQGVLCVSHLVRKDDGEEPEEITSAVRLCAADISAEFGPTPKP